MKRINGCPLIIFYPFSQQHISAFELHWLTYIDSHVILAFYDLNIASFRIDKYERLHIAYDKLNNARLVMTFILEK